MSLTLSMKLKRFFELLDRCCCIVIPREISLFSKTRSGKIQRETRWICGHSPFMMHGHNKDVVARYM